MLLRGLERARVIAEPDRGERYERVVHRYVVRPLFKIAENRRRQEDENHDARNQVQDDLPDEVDLMRDVLPVGRQLELLVASIQPDVLKWEESVSY